MAWQAVYYGIEAIEDGVQSMVDTTQPFYYKIWYNSKDPFIQYNGGDYDTGLKFMTDNLEQLASNDFGFPLCFKFYNEKASRGHLYKSECAAVMYVCVLEREKQVELKQMGLISGYSRGLSNVPSGYMSEKQWQDKKALEDLPETIGRVVAEQLALLRPIETAAIEAAAETVPDTIGSVLMGHLKDPEVVNQVIDKFPVIIDGIQRLLSGILPGIVNAPVAMSPGRVSGVTGQRRTTIVKSPADIAQKSDVGQTPCDTNKKSDDRSDIDHIAENSGDGSVMQTGDIAESGDTPASNESAFIEFNTKIDNALEVLNNHCLLDVVLPALAKMATDEPDKFKMGLAFLGLQ